MKLRDVLQLLVLSAIWGASFLLIRISVGSFPPAWVAMLRLFFGSAFLWMVLLIKRSTLPPLRLLVPLLIVALFNHAIPFILFPLGERVVPSNIAAVINATTPIWALFLGAIFAGRKAEGGAIPGVVLGFLGVLLVVFSHSTEGTSASRHDYLLGIGYIAIASTAYAVAAVLAKAKLVNLDPLGLAATQLSLALVLVAPVALLGPHPATVRMGSLAAAATLGILGSGLAYFIFYRLLERVSPTRVVSVTFFGPVWGLFWGRIAHEAIAPPAYVGVAIVVAGLVLLSRPPKAAIKLDEHEEGSAELAGAVSCE